MVRLNSGSMTLNESKEKRFWTSELHRQEVAEELRKQGWKVSMEPPHWDGKTKDTGDLYITKPHLKRWYRCEVKHINGNGPSGNYLTKDDYAYPYNSMRHNFRMSTYFLSDAPVTIDEILGEDVYSVLFTHVVHIYNKDVFDYWEGTSSKIDVILLANQSKKGSFVVYGQDKPKWGTAIVKDYKRSVDIGKDQEEPAYFCRVEDADFKLWTDRQWIDEYKLLNEEV